MNKCDQCNTAENLDYFFWLDGEIETENQIKVADKMQSLNYECVCEECFFKLKGR